MKFSSQIYLDCYSNLHSPEASKQANKTLLEIYQSQDAWKIAEELMLQEAHMIHGSQLLSQKLNSPLPFEINPEMLAMFLLSIKNISNLHWLCLAKLFVHTHQSINDLKIEGPLSIDIKLNILKQVPHAISQMRIEFGVKSSVYKAEVFKQNKYLIMESIKFISQNKGNTAPEMKKLEDLLLETLQSFTQHQVTLDSEEIAAFILESSESDKASNLLEHIFLEEQYPNLEAKLEQFLRKNFQNEEKDWIKIFYLNFYAKKDIFVNFSLQKYTEVLRTVTIMMTTEDDQEFRTILSESYEFWISLINKLAPNQSIRDSSQFKQKQQLLQQSLFKIYEVLCKHSKLKKCPSSIKFIQSNLDIVDLDGQQDIVGSSSGQNTQDQFAEINFNVNQIREMSIDLLIKIEEGLKADSQMYRKMFELLLLLASSNQSVQSLELAIFVVDGMTDFCDQQSKPYLSELIKVILDQKESLNEYICQRIVILLGKIDKIIVSNISMFPSVFQFFSNTIMYDKLSSLASQSFTDLMDQYQINNFIADQEFKQKSEKYLNFWFETFYSKIKSEKVLENITKALVIFVYKFKGSEYYDKFLFMMSQKIKTSSDCSLQEIYLQAVITGQNWINSRSANNNQQYLVAFANFMNEFLDLLVNNCFKVNRKPDFTKAVSKINWALKTGSYFTNVEGWLEMLKQIINKSLFETQGDVLSVGLTPLITILKSDLMTKNHMKAVFLCLQSILNKITQLFVNIHSSKTTIDYNFSKYVIQIHNLTVSMLLKNKDLSQANLINYHPSTLLGFIKEKIFRNKTFWEYEVYKETLIFLNELIMSNYEVQTICFEVLGICGRTLQSLWIQTENIFLNVYKQKGIQPFVNSLQKLKPEVLAPNPLFSILQQGLQKSDRKMLKSFVRCL